MIADMTSFKKQPFEWWGHCIPIGSTWTQNCWDTPIRRSFAMGNLGHCGILRSMGPWDVLICLSRLMNPVHVSWGIHLSISAWQLQTSFRAVHFVISPIWDIIRLHLAAQMDLQQIPFPKPRPVTQKRKFISSSSSSCRGFKSSSKNRDFFSSAAPSHWGAGSDVTNQLAEDLLKHDEPNTPRRQECVPPAGWLMVNWPGCKAHADAMDLKQPNVFFQRLTEHISAHSRPARAFALPLDLQSIRSPPSSRLGGKSQRTVQLESPRTTHPARSHAHQETSSPGDFFEQTPQRKTSHTISMLCSLLEEQVLTYFSFGDSPNNLAETLDLTPPLMQPTSTWTAALIHRPQNASPSWGLIQQIWPSPENNRKHWSGVWNKRKRDLWPRDISDCCKSPVLIHMIHNSWLEYTGFQPHPRHGLLPARAIQLFHSHIIS